MHHQIQSILSEATEVSDVLCFCKVSLNSEFCLLQPPKRYWQEEKNEDDANPDKDKNSEAQKEFSDKKHKERQKKRKSGDGKFISGVCMFNTVSLSGS